MTLDQLKYFETAANTLHIGKAAQLLNISQPSLSISIKKLEAELEVPLFQSEGRGIALTSYGRDLLPYARSILQQTEAAKKHLKKEADKIGAKLIHISTDCVFSGKKGRYTEDDFRDADDVYGRSKALGEINNERDLTIRTSIIGPELKENGEGLFHWFMMQKGSVYGFKTAIWGGVTTLELAKAIDVAIEEGKTGLIQLSNGVGISKYDLLCLFKEIWQKQDVEILPYDANGVDKSIARSARFDYEVPTYRRMLEDMRDWMLARQELYAQYLD